MIGDREDRFSGKKHRRTARLNRVERTAPAQAFNLPPVEQPCANPIRKIINRNKSAAIAAHSAQRFHRPLTHAFKRAKRIANGKLPFANWFDTEIGKAGVEARWQADDRHPPHIIGEDAKLVSIADIVTHRRGEEIGWIMRLEPRRLIGEQRIGRRVAFIEAIACKLVNQVKQLIGFRRRNLMMLGTTGDKGLALGVHLGLDLFAHRAAQQIRATKRIAAKHLSGLHHLFLIHEHAVCLGQNIAEQRMGIFNRDATIFAVTK